MVKSFNQKYATDDYAKDGGEEVLTKMHCVLIMNPYRFYRVKSSSPPSLAYSPIRICFGNFTIVMTKHVRPNSIRDCLANTRVKTSIKGPTIFCNKLTWPDPTHLYDGFYIEGT